MDQIKKKDRKKIFQANGTRKQAGIAMLPTGNIDFKQKLTKRKKTHFHIH